MGYRVVAALKPTGMPAWVLQRISALLMLMLLMGGLGAGLLWDAPSYSQWQTWVSHPAVSAAIFVFFAALLLHAWVGLRDVLLDYARPAGLRTALLVALAASLAGLAFWLVLILLRVQP